MSLNKFKVNHLEIKVSNKRKNGKKAHRKDHLTSKIKAWIKENDLCK